MTTKRDRLTPVLVAVCVFLLLLAGCSTREKDAVADVDPETAAQSILENVTFRDTLVKADSATAENQYRLSDAIESYSIWIAGSGGTAEEIAVLKISDSATLSDARAMIDKRIEELKFRFQDYVPKEMTKLEDPVIVENGRLVILVLADDYAAAKQAVDSLFD